MPNSPELMVLSEERARGYEPSRREVCISITGPGKPQPELSNHFLAILRLAFTDIAKPSPFRWDLLFNEDHAREILTFIGQWRDVDRIVIHCMAGQGRSAGVAMGLCDVFTWDIGKLELEHPLWNTWVRQELVRVGREPQRPDARNVLPNSSVPED
jgi:predicted protein tyrosine phosphatase